MKYALLLNDEGRTNERIKRFKREDESNKETQKIYEEYDGWRSGAIFVCVAKEATQETSAYKGGRRRRRQKHERFGGLFQNSKISSLFGKISSKLLRDFVLIFRV